MVKAFIAVEKEQNTYVGIYCRRNGYPSGVGKILQEHYNSREKVEELIAMGAVYNLGEKIGEGNSPTSPDWHNVCMFYDRDLHQYDLEDNTYVKPQTAMGLTGGKGLYYLAERGNMAEFLYVFTLDNQWYRIDLYGGHMWLPLSEKENQHNPEWEWFINISDEYGPPVPVTIADYRELNPEGIFEERYVYDALYIIEKFSDEPGDFEIVAEEQ